MAASNDAKELLSSYPPGVRTLALGLRRLVQSRVPGADELVDRSSNVIGYGYGAGYADMICTIILSKKGVKLGVVGGAALDDPQQLLEGSGKRHRYVNIEDAADLERPGIGPLLDAALAAWKQKRRAS
jgi:hypothetical protein